MSSRTFLRSLRASLVLVTLTFAAAPALARTSNTHRIYDVSKFRIPSYSRQTGLACSVCHTSFPQLTAFGRMFKMNGYTMPGGETVKATNKSDETTLQIGRIFPLSFMAQSSISWTNARVPDTQNGDVAFPQEMSLFVGGEITPKIGTFVQVTYAPEDGSFGLDNAELRFADQTSLGDKKLVYGLTLNNNPTMEDVWNSTPAWSFPYASSEVAPGPGAGTLVDGGLAQQVAGLGAYGMWNDVLYAQAAVYRSAQQGADQPPGAGSSGVVDGVAPYWRLALQHSWGLNYAELGTYGLHARLFPEGVQGATDRFTDLAADAEYQRQVGGGWITAYGTWIHERRNLQGTLTGEPIDLQKSSLDSYRLNAGYHMVPGVGFTAGFFATTGDANSALYGPDPVEGSRTGSPDSDGLIGQLDFQPWLNTRIALQYTLYTKFNGATDNYDGFGRSASDNNTLYLLTWLVF